MVDKVVCSHSVQASFAAKRRHPQSTTTTSSATPTITTTPPPPKEIQCSFRLIHILFSDEFAANFATLGNVAGRNVLDSGTAGNDKGFWVCVQNAFVEPHPDYDQLCFLDDNVIASQDTIDPGIIINHDWKKLQKIWKGVNAEYKATLKRYTTSGPHKSMFYYFCYGKFDTYTIFEKIKENDEKRREGEQQL
jgi:hypothetical protein